jgi:23S rRNA pseudouridine1911/1915/1917 synthase
LVQVEPDLSRSQIKRLIEDGHVTLNGQAARVSARLKEGDCIEVTIPPAAPIEAEPEDIPLKILFEDEHLIVVDKDAGMVVHPAPGHASGTLVNALLAHCTDLSGVGGRLRPGIVHRIDKDTTGILVVSKSDAAHAGLAEGFKDKTHEREYLALVSPAPRKAKDTIQTLFGRHPVHRKKFSSKVQRGKEAITHYEIEEALAGAALLRVHLETGRTHQIRVHCADSGFPILGDPVYSRPPRREPLRSVAAELGRQALHAHVLGFVHPITQETLHFVSPLPDDMTRALALLRQE